jgi:hypothetical protein
MKLYAKTGAQKLQRNPFAVGELDRFIPAGTIPVGSVVDVEKFVVERFPDGTRRFAVLTTGEYVDSAKLSSYYFLSDEEKNPPKPPVKRNYGLLKILAIVAVFGIAYRSFRKGTT